MHKRHSQEWRLWHCDQMPFRLRRCSYEIQLVREERHFACTLAVCVVGKNQPVTNSRNRHGDVSPNAFPAEGCAFAEIGRNWRRKCGGPVGVDEACWCEWKL